MIMMMMMTDTTVMNSTLDIFILHSRTVSKVRMPHQPQVTRWGTNAIPLGVCLRLCRARQKPCLGLVGFTVRQAVHGED